MEGKSAGINANLFSLLLFFLALAAMVLSGAQVRRAGIRMNQQLQIEEDKRISQEKSQMFEDASDYLTNEVRYFAVTGKREHLDNYWSEIKDRRNRDQAVRQLKNLSLDDKEQALIEGARKESDYLIIGETWAMRLVCDSLNISLEEMPKEVAAVVYENGEDRFSPRLKQEKARQYLYGEEYTRSKRIIRENVRGFKNALAERKEQELALAALRTNKALIRAQMATLIVLGILLVSLLSFHALATRPLHAYARALQNIRQECFTPLAPSGFQETKSFARAFNQIYGEWEEQRQRLKEERARFQTAIESTPVIVYDYNLEQDTYVAFGNLEENDREMRGIPMQRTVKDCKKNISTFLGEEGRICLEEKMETGDYSPVDLLAVPYPNEPDKKIWIRISGKPLYDKDGKLVKIVGKIASIQGEKEKELELKEAKSKDPLTGFYNRDSGISRVRFYIAQRKPGLDFGLLLLDMDDMEELEKQEGSIFAEAILQETAEIIRSLTGDNDILTRLGGDELMVLATQRDRSQVMKLGEEIAEAVRNLSSEKNLHFQVSASIGMCSSIVTEDYGELYRCAESALHYAKKNARGKAMGYLEASKEAGEILTVAYPEVYAISQINSSYGSKHDDILTFALDLLGKASNLDDAIYLLLARIGRRCHVDRVSIAEIDTEYLSCHMQHQWCADPADSQLGSVYYVKANELRRLASAYDDEGLCSQYVLSGLSEMNSILHAGIWNCGTLEGIMSMEARPCGRVWTKEERQLFGELVKVTASFVQKAKADAVSQAKTDFLSRMSHEIRTPLNAIVGMTAIAKTVLNDPEKELCCLNKIETANQYLIELINDILDMSRISSGKVEINTAPTDLSALISNAAGLLTAQAGQKGVSLIVENQIPAGCFVMADELRLNQILVNLLGNAVKFTPKGGSVTMAARKIEADEESIKVCFSVKDTGIGIRKEAQDRIFNAFEQADKSTASAYGGTGLGLTISSRLVQMMGGLLEVDSAPGKGAEFCFTVNFYLTQKPACAILDTEPKQFNLTGKRILLVEDNEINREIAQSLLELHGLEVESAKDGQKAVDQFQSHSAFYYDAILMDIRMPLLDGFEASRIIRTMEKEDSRTIPIIAMTANAFDEDMKKSIENGMNGYLKKPVEVEKVLDTLRKCIYDNEAAKNRVV